MLSTPLPVKSSYQWGREITYIRLVTSRLLGGLPGFERSAFIAYAEVQRDCATRDQRLGAAAVIARCINLLEQ